MSAAYIPSTAKDISYASGTVADALDTLLYVATDITGLTNDGGSPVEIGTGKTNIHLAWTVNPSGRVLTSQTLNGSTINVDDRSATLPGPITTTTTWTVAGTDGKSSDSMSTTLTFSYARYYGVSDLTTLTDAQVKLALTKEIATQSRIQTRTINADAHYIYFLWPDSWGPPSFTVNGLPNTAWTLVRNDAFTNDAGSTYPIRLYRSDNLLTGTYTIGVS